MSLALYVELLAWEESDSKHTQTEMKWLTNKLGWTHILVEFIHLTSWSPFGLRQCRILGHPHQPAHTHTHTHTHIHARMHHACAHTYSQKYCVVSTSKPCPSHRLIINILVQPHPPNTLQLTPSVWGPW